MEWSDVLATAVRGLPQGAEEAKGPSDMTRLLWTETRPKLSPLHMRCTTFVQVSDLRLA